ncbi:MAG TPA: heme-dependent oxidative N-demethylase subunit alpha family protein, partial [Asticcacaulis sp.]|nr:heme-dependent oxidative N-demethylase subunit alpha family protein [Asticcacaulis sp.]
MPERPFHTPYDGSSKLFTIGVKPLDPTAWIDVDDRLRRYLDEKDRLAERVPDNIFVAEPNTEAAQAEVLTLLADHLPQRFPDIYQRIGPQIDIVPAFRRVRLDTPYPPLLIAGGLVQEDLVLMRR